MRCAESGRPREPATTTANDYPSDVDIVWRSFELDPTESTEPSKALDAALAAKYGVPIENARAMLETVQFVDEVRADQLRARQLGIQGVPFFVFAGRVGVSGAQPAGVLLDAMRQAA